MQHSGAAKIEGNILYEPSRFGKPGQQLFEPDYWLSLGTGAAISGGRGQVLFIRDEQRRWVLRHYRRGGLIAKFNHDAYLWTGAENTRSFLEYRLLAKLIEIGLPVPVPVAARYVRSGLMYRADLISEEIVGARTLTSLLNAQTLTSGQWSAIGTTLARFHRQGVKHADLNAHNIVIDEANAIHVLDFDRGYITKIDRQWIDNVLARLLRSLTKLKAQQQIHFSGEDWKHLLTSHDQALGI